MTQGKDYKKIVEECLSDAKDDAQIIAKANQYFEENMGYKDRKFFERVAYKDIMIFHMDFAGLDGESIAIGVYFLSWLYDAWHEGKELSIAIDGRNTIFNMSSMEAINYFKPKARKINSRAAIYGLEIVQRTFLNIVKSNYYYPETKEEAFEWLLKKKII